MFSSRGFVSRARRQLNANPSVSRGLVGFFYVAFEGNDSLSLCKVYSVLHHFALLSKLFGYFEQVNSSQLLTTRVKPFCKMALVMPLGIEPRLSTFGISYEN